MIGRRLLMGGGGSFTPPAPSAAGVTVDSIDTLDTGATSQDWHGRASVIRKLDDTMILTWRDGSAHGVNDGALHIAYSDDNGATWSAKDTHLDTTAVGNFPMNPPGLIAGEDAGEPTLVRFPNDDLGLLMWKADYGVRANGTYMSRSTDDGETWGTPTGPLEFTGFGATASTHLRTFATDQGFIDQVTGDFYMGARIYPSQTILNKATLILVKSTDNGTTWTRVSSAIMSLSENGATGGQEVGLTQIGASDYLFILRDNPQRKTFLKRSDDRGLTFTSLLDITSLVGIVVRPRIYTGKQLRGEANWHLDPNIIMVGAETLVPGNSQARANSVWISQDAGTSWDTFNVDTNTYGGDGGYGDVFYDATTGLYRFVCYRGSLSAADLIQYSLTITGL